MDSKNLYQDVILDHNRKPRNWGNLADASHRAEGLNPLCGDHIWLSLKLDGSKAVERIAHTHTDAACYRCEAHAVPSRDGLRVLWASDWMIAGGGTGSTSITQAFVVDTRP